MQRVREWVRGLPRGAFVGAAIAGLLATVALVAGASGGDPVTSSDPTAAAEATSPAPVVSGGTTTPASAATPGASPGTTTSTVAATPLVTIDLDQRYEFDVDENMPAVMARPIPDDPVDTAPIPTIAPPPWAASTRTTAGGYVGVDVGCADDLSADSLDRLFAARLGPLIGWDYQHVYPLGGDRFLWLFQDAFLDHGGTAITLGGARFVHNAALLQTGTCFTLLHGGTPAKPLPFEQGDGSDNRTRWFWPMGGEVSGRQVWVFWAEMVKDPYDPDPPDGLGWHPNRLYVAGYDRDSLANVYFALAPDSGVAPMFGYAVASDASYSYLFGNTFEQNLLREGGFWNGPHSATSMWLARVPHGQLTSRPEYRTAAGWSPNRADAVPIVNRFFAENPMQPRYLDGQWVAATKVDGYWGEAMALDVAPAPWGPWSTVDYFGLQNRGNDPKKNTYHAHLLPWRDAYGSVLVTASNNARDMLADAWPRPDRYRPMVFFRPYQPTPEPTTTSSSTSSPSTSTTTSTTSAVTTTSTSTSTTSTSTTSTTSTTTVAPPVTSTSTVAPTSTSSTTPASTSTTSAPTIAPP